MPEQESFSDLVKIEWEISQPEGAIRRLMEQLTALESRFNAVSAAAARAGQAAGGSNVNTGGYSPPPPGSEYVTQRRYPAGTPGGLGGRYAPAGFDNVFRSGEEPTGIGAQYVPEGVRRRYSFVDPGAGIALGSPNWGYYNNFSGDSGIGSALVPRGGGPNWTFGGPPPPGYFGSTPLLGAGGGAIPPVWGGTESAGWGGFASGWGGGGRSYASGATINQGGAGGPGGPGNSDIDEAGDAFNIFDNKFARHISWIAQGIAIWGALHVAMDGVKIVLSEIANLESVQSRLGFINGASLTNVAEGNLAGAAYGLTPTQSGAGLIAAGQLGLNKAQQNDARKASLVFGADQYLNITQEIYQTNKAMETAGVSGINQLDYLATAYKTAAGSVEDYGDSLQYGIKLSHDLGIESTQTGLAILRVSQATEDSPKNIGTTLQAVISRLRQPQTQENLKAFGITPGKPEDMIRQISAEVSSLTQSGQLDRLKDLMAELTGGITGPARQLQLTAIFAELQPILEGNVTQLESMDKLVTRIGDTGTAHWNRLTASALAYLDALIGVANAGGGAKAVFWGAGEQFLTDQANRINYVNSTGLDTQRNGKDTPAYLEYLDRNKGIPDYASEGNRFSYKPSGTGVASKNPGTIGPYPAPPSPFGGFQTMTPGFDWDKFTKGVGDYEKQLAKVPGYTLDPKEVAFFDSSGQYYKSIIGDLNAIRWSSDEQRKLMQQQITGTFNVPAGGEVMVLFAALANNIGPNYGGSGAGTGTGTGTGATGYNAAFQAAANSIKKKRGVDDDIGLMEPKFVDESPEKNMMKRMHKADLFAPGGGKSTTGDATSDRFRRDQNQQMGKLQSLVVNNTIRVYIDGRQVSHVVQRQNYRSFENIRNSAFTAPSSQVAV